MKTQYDMSMLESVVADNTPKELAAALQAILLDSCVYYTDVASRGCPDSTDAGNIILVRQLLVALQETHQK